MVTKEIVEGNKLIAEFFGYFDESYKWAKRMNVEYNHNEDIPMLAGLRYHASWDWLMPVVEKIRGLHTDKKIKRDDLSVGADRIFCLHLISSKIDIVYDLVVDFIKWYNSKNKQNGNR